MQYYALLKKALYACLMTALFSTVQAKLFVPDLEPWGFWLPSDESATAIIDHSLWQSTLDGYLVTDAADRIYRFDYAAVTSADRQSLQVYLQMLASIDPRKYSRAEQQAYWINFYNALTVEVVLDHYPVKSIRKIYGGLLGTGPWDEPLTVVAGQTLSLNDIEHRILRPIWGDPRIHYAVNCASLGCPNLMPQTYSAANAGTMLDAGARAFVNHPRGVSLSQGTLTLSSIYDWYDSDFGADQAGLIDHLAKYAEPQLAVQLKTHKGRVDYDYNWQLNELSAR